MHFDRMDMLLQILRTVDEKQFTMDRWCDNRIGEEACGFAGCAMGWAAQSPYFQKLGLSLEHVGVCVPSVFIQQLILLGTDGIKLEGFEAASTVLGITNQEAEHLFDPEAYDDFLDPEEIIKPKHVIARIEDFMRKQVKA